MFSYTLAQRCSESSLRQGDARAQRYARRRQLIDEPCVNTEFNDDLDDEDVTCAPILDKGTQTNMKVVAVASVQTEPVSFPHC